MALSGDDYSTAQRNIMYKIYTLFFNDKGKKSCKTNFRLDDYFYKKKTNEFPLAIIIIHLYWIILIIHAYNKGTYINHVLL